ncbi:MAG: hypothetical protein KBD94_05155 [Pyrinomonadaceae bacterium]|nr:hypothetical protein [Pyrinomonadaceae bacterium]
MVPSYKWFPMNLPERAAWYRNFNDHMQVIGASLGITAAELLSLAKDTENVLFFIAGRTALDNYSASFRTAIREFTEGRTDERVVKFPASPVLTVPHPDQPRGAYLRLVRLVARVRAAPGFNSATEAQLGLGIQKLAKVSLKTLTPKITPITRSGGVIEVKFVRGRSTGINIQINADNTGWADAGRFFKSPAVFTVPKSESGAPRNVQIRAQYLDGNTPVGKFSPMPTVQTVP